MFYNFPKIDDDEYSRLREEGVDPVEIIQILVQFGTSWKWSETDVINFPTSGITSWCKA